MYCCRYQHNRPRMLRCNDLLYLIARSTWVGEYINWPKKILRRNRRRTHRLTGNMTKSENSRSQQKSNFRREISNLSFSDTPTRPVLYWFLKGLHSATATQNTDEHCFYALEVTQQEATLQSLPLFRSLNSQMPGEHCQNR